MREVSSLLEFETIKEPVAAKQYKCSLCGLKIEKGEKYAYRAAKYDGYFFTEYLHFDCRAVISEYGSEVDSEYNQDDIAEWWNDAKCHNCKKYYTEPCENALCEFFDGGNCCDMAVDGKCKCSEPCDIWDRYCWCTQYEPENKDNRRTT